MADALVHLLPLCLDNTPRTPVARSWIHYEKKLEEGVLAYRSQGKDRRGYLGEAFVTAHSFSTEKLVDPMFGLVDDYIGHDPDALAKCYDKVRRY